MTSVDNLDNSYRQFNGEFVPFIVRGYPATEATDRASLRNSGKLASKIEVRVSATEISNRLNLSNPEMGIMEIEGLWSNQFMNYFGEKIPEIKTYTSIKEMLGKIEKQTGQKPAIVYAIASP